MFARSRNQHSGAPQALQVTNSLVTTKSMRPSTSAFAHSQGALTIGSSCTLKLVLTSTGVPVSRSKAENNIVVERVGITRDRLRSRRAVHVDHGHDALAPSGPYVTSDGHEATGVPVDRIDVEHLARVSTGTTGANGMNSVRSSRSLRRSCVSRRDGFARIERAPSARADIPCVRWRGLWHPARPRNGEGSTRG